MYTERELLCYGQGLRLGLIVGALGRGPVSEALAAAALHYRMTGDVYLLPVEYRDRVVAVEEEIERAIRHDSI